MPPKAALALKRHLRPRSPTVLVGCEGPLLERGEGGVAGADAEGRDGDLDDGGGGGLRGHHEGEGLQLAGQGHRQVVEQA